MRSTFGAPLAGSMVAGQNGVEVRGVALDLALELLRRRGNLQTVDGGLGGRRSGGAGDRLGGRRGGTDRQGKSDDRSGGCSLHACLPSVFDYFVLKLADMRQRLLGRVISEQYSLGREKNNSLVPPSNHYFVREVGGPGKAEIPSFDRLLRPVDRNREFQPSMIGRQFSTSAPQPQKRMVKEPSPWVWLPVPREFRPLMGAGVRFRGLLNVRHRSERPSSPKPQPMAGLRPSCWILHAGATARTGSDRTAASLHGCCVSDCPPNVRN